MKNNIASIVLLVIQSVALIACGILIYLSSRKTKECQNRADAGDIGIQLWKFTHQAEKLNNGALLAALAATVTNIAMHFFG